MAKKKHGTKKTSQAAHEAAASPTDLNFSILLIILPCFLALFVLYGTFKPTSYPIIGVDAVGYYSWVRSLIFDHDVDFENEYRTLNPYAIASDQFVNPDGPRTATGRLGNPFAIGPGLLWFPFITIGHLAAWGTGEPRDGFSQPYFTSVFLANMVYAWLGVVLTFLALRRWFDSRLCAIAAVAAWAASPALYYTHAQFAFAHACSFFTVALFLFVWSRYRERADWWAWLLIGACVGLAALVRAQNVLYAAVVAIDLLWRDRMKNIPNMVAASVGCFIVFLPQMFAWNTVYGSFLTIPQGPGFMQWTRPDILSTLFSTGHGLITWTPLWAFGIIGLCMIPKDQRRIFVPLLVAFVLQLYIVSVAGDVGWSFGMRRMTGATPLLAVGLALLVTRLRIRPFVAMAAAGVFVFWNFLFVLQYGGILDDYYIYEKLTHFAADRGTTPEELYTTSRLPDGANFNIYQFAQENQFPREGPLTFQELVSDKIFVFLSLFGLGP